MGRVEEALAPLFPPGREADRQRAARVLWAGVHGITSLSTADKLSVVTTETASRLVDDLVGTYLAGLASEAASAASGDEGPGAHALRSRRDARSQRLPPHPQAAGGRWRWRRRRAAPSPWDWRR